MSYKACAIEVLVGAVNVTPSTAVGYVRDWTYNGSAERVDVAVGCDAAFLGGRVTREVTLVGFSRHLPSVDSGSTQDAGQASFVEGAAVSLALRPAGTGSGKPQLQCLDVFVESLQAGGTNQGAVTWNVGLVFNEAPDDTDQA